MSSTTRHRQAKSLAFRLYLISAGWGIIALVIISLLLTALFRGSMERSFDRQIVNSMRELTRLLAARAANPDSLDEIEEIGLADPQYLSPVSGWYWQIIRTADDEVMAESKSLFGEALPDWPALEPDASGLDRRSGQGLDGEPLRVLRRDLDVSGVKYRLIATGNLQSLEDDVASFRNRVVLSLGLFGLSLVIASFLMVKFGLQPLEQIRRSLTAIRSGQETRLRGSFPAEINPLVEEVNALLQSNQGILDRARTHVGNLAHGLKTPLSVLTNEAARHKDPGWNLVREHTDLMKAQIDTYLSRAQMAASSKTLTDSVGVHELIDPLIRTMRRLYPEVELIESNLVPAGTRFRGERHDLEELLGNLIDNACKYANGQVEVRLQKQKNQDRPGVICLIIDNGPGLSDEQIAVARKRGQRLDQHQPGSGLGLSIVDELVQIYSGDLDIRRAKSGGLECRLQLPTVD